MDLITDLKSSKSFDIAKKSLIELRNYLFKMLCGLFVGIAIAYYYQTPIYDLYINPLKVNNLTLSFLSPTDSIMFYIKIYAISGLIISLPYQILIFWQYVKDALQESERKIVRNYFWCGSMISVIAVIYGWLFMIPSVFKFLVSVTLPQTQLLLTAGEYSSFIVGLMLMLIATFQIPLVVFTLISTGLFSKAQIASKRREIYMIILILTAVFGSPDVFTWLLSALPVILLFELSLFFARNTGAKQKQE